MLFMHINRGKFIEICSMFVMVYIVQIEPHVCGSVGQNCPLLDVVKRQPSIADLCSANET